ncbi:MAG: rod shape-determining protein MreD [Fibrobacterota bacterium]
MNLRKTIMWLFVFSLTLLLQSTAVYALSIRGARPDLTIIMLAFFSFREGPFAGTIAGFLIGLTQGVYSPSHLGETAFAKTLIGYLCGLMNENTIFLNNIHRSLVVFISVLIQGAATFRLSAGRFTGMWSHLVEVSGPSALYSAIVGLLLFKFLSSVIPQKIT